MVWLYKLDKIKLKEWNLTILSFINIIIIETIYPIRQERNKINIIIKYAIDYIYKLTSIKLTYSLIIWLIIKENKNKENLIINIFTFINNISLLNINIK